MVRVFFTGILYLVVQAAVLGNNSGYYSSNISHSEFILAMSLEEARFLRYDKGELEGLLQEKVSAIMRKESLLTGHHLRSQYRTISIDEESYFGVMLVEVPEMSDIQRIILSMWLHQGVLWAHPNYIYIGDFMEGLTNDPHSSRQGHLSQIFATEAWKTHRGSEEVIVAVTDDGFDLKHEDTQRTYYRNPDEIPNNGKDDDENGYIDDVFGWNFVSGNNNVQAGGGNGDHGTHIAGTIAADSFNDLGIAGVAPGVQIMPLKWYDSYRPWTSAIIYETYAYAAQQGARIISTSYNVDFLSKDPTYLKALDFVHNKGVLVFNSAGNSSKLNPNRSLLDKILLVASVQTKANTDFFSQTADRISSFSNYGLGIDLAAPGDPIWATYSGSRYGNMRGTSMATPVAASIAALIWSQYPDLTANQVAHKVLTSADDISDLNGRYRFYLGTGRVNAAKALQESTGLLRAEVAETYFKGNHLNRPKALTVKFYGVVEELDAPFELLAAGDDGIFDGFRDYRINLQYDEEVFYGTNFKRVTFSRLSSGRYRFIISADNVIDPYGRKLDGDGNGTAGGDYVTEFTVR